MFQQTEGSVVFVSDLPQIDCRGGVLTIDFKSGGQHGKVAIPLWLVRLIRKRVGDLLREQDSNRAAA